MMGTRTVQRPAPAKINLSLHITGQRDDGYHLLDSLVVRASFGDHLRFEASDVDTIHIRGRFASDLNGTDPAQNLIAKARDALRLATDPQLPAVAITLEKALPVASGVGGGSADAAATLRGLASLWALPLTDSTLEAIALTLGADVPMCLYDGPMRVQGIGADIQAIDTLPAFNIVAVNPGIGVATPTVFSTLTNKTNPAMDMAAAPLGNADMMIDWLAAVTRNDLYLPAVAHCGVIDAVLAMLDAHGARLARMSGSGATCFGLFSRMDTAQIAADAIAALQPDWFVAAGQTLPGGV